MNTAGEFFVYSLTIIMILVFIGIAADYIRCKVREYKDVKECKRRWKEYYKQQKLKDNESNN